MPELNWVGKDKVITHHLDVPYRVLDRQYSYDEHGQHDADNGSQNRSFMATTSKPSKLYYQNTKARLTAFISILPITQATKAGSTTTPSTTHESRNGLAKSSAKKAKTSPAMTNGYA